MNITFIYLTNPVTAIITTVDLDEELGVGAGIPVFWAAQPRSRSSVKLDRRGERLWLKCHTLLQFLLKFNTFLKYISMFAICMQPLRTISRDFNLKKEKDFLPFMVLYQGESSQSSSGSHSRSALLFHFLSASLPQVSGPVLTA